MKMLVSTEQVNKEISEQPSIDRVHCEGTTSQQSQLKQIFADLHEFQVGELSRLCISRDYFGSGR